MLIVCFPCTDRVANDPVIQVVVIPMIAHKSEDRISLTKVIEFLEDPKGIPAAFETMKTKLSPPAPRYLTGAEITPISGLEMGVNSG